MITAHIVDIPAIDLVHHTIIFGAGVVVGWCVRVATRSRAR